MERSAELRELVQAWFASASAGDGSLVDRHVSRSEMNRLIGSDPAEWIQGGPAVTEFLKGEVESSAGSVTFTPSDIEAFSEGTVGWAAAHLTISIPDGGRVSPRWSAVFHREDDVWKFVQTHASIPVKNDEIGWEYSG